MTKREKLLGAGALMMFGVIQFVGPWPTNPPVIKSHTMQSQLQIPPAMASIMNRACVDCHSHETRWPWYSHVAPVRWWLVNHVNKGRKDLNFSEWTQYQPSFAAATLGSMSDAAARGLMPLASYGTLHQQAKLTDEEAKAFCDWAKAERGHLLKVLWDEGTERAAAH